MFQSIGQLPDYGAGLDAALQKNAAMPKPKTGMFGGGKFGLGEAIVAALNGYLAGTGNPVGMANMQMIAEKRRQQQEAAQSEDQYQRQRGDSMQDWIAKQQWELANPGPTQGSEFERALEASGIQRGTPQWAEYMGRKRDLSLNPIIMTPMGPMPYSAVAGAQAQQVPQTLSDDDWPTLGGAGSQAPRPFPY